MRVRTVLLALLLVGSLALTACSSAPEEGTMGAGAMVMYDPTDPAFRVVSGQVMEIDTATGTRGGLSVLLRTAKPDWRAAAEKAQAVEQSWGDIRMEMERRAAAKPEVRLTTNRFDWHFNVLSAAIREEDRVKANQAFTDLMAAWQDVKATLREVEVDGWRLATVVIALFLILLFSTDALILAARRLDRRFMLPRAKQRAPADPATPGAEEAAAAPAPITNVPSGSLNLLDAGPIRAFAKSKYVPLTFQVFMLVVFAAAIYGSIVGMEMRESNFGLLMFWTIFWPSMIMISLVTVGRMWCAICPLGAISAAAQRLGLNRSFPLALRNGVIALVLYIVVIWLIREPFGLSDNSILTAWFFGLTTIAAVAVGLVFRDRAWCQYVCPIGIVSGLWSMLSFLELRPTKARCDACRSYECVRGDGQVRGCPMGLHPGRLDSNRDCIYCMNCVKTCPYNSPQIRLRMPGAELVNGSKRSLVDAGFALWVVVVLALKENMEHYFTPPFLVSATTWLQNLLGTANRQGVWFYVVVAFNGALLLAAYLLATGFASRTLGWPFRRTFATFGYMFIPVVLVTIGGHSLNAILTMWGGPLVTMVMAPLGISAYLEPSLLGPAAAKLVSDGFARPALYALGFAWMIALPYAIASFRTADKWKALRAAAPFILIAFAIAADFLWTHNAMSGGTWRW